MSKSTSADSNKFWKGFWPSMAVLVVILGFLFRESFKPGIVHFSNDGPLGVMMSAALAVPSALTGFWMDLSWIGMNGGAAPSSITYLLVWLLGPVGFAKFYPPIALLLLGAGAWIFFRTLKLSPGLCLVAAIAAALNMNFFSNTCWGLGTRALTLMSAFLALAALMNRRRGNRWLNAALAGLCVGLGVIEGADNGAIFSLFIAAFVLFQSFTEELTLARKIASCVRLGVVGLCAALIAAQVLVTLTGIAAKTSRGAKSETAAAAPLSAEQKKAEDLKQWVFATQWSLPPTEMMLRTIIPGIYGYRMDTPNGGEYWGRVGENWSVPESPQRRASRSSGAGEYAGVLVVLVGLWAVAHALRRRTGPAAIFDDKERWHVLFWAAMFIPAALLSWGYHAPFYKLVFSLPYFSTIRNPMKFMHPGHMTLLILFGYGLLGLSRRYLETALANAQSLGQRFKNWRAKALPVERRWMIGSMLAALLGLFVFVAYSGARGKLAQHLANIGFPNPTDAAIASHSVNEVALFAVILAVSVALVTFIQIGMFSGGRRAWAVVILGALVTVDLGRADHPWIQPYNYQQRYASNPVLDILRKEPWLHRTAAFSRVPVELRQFAQHIAIAYNVAGRGQWLQWHYQYYNIQSLDMPQEPRPPSEKTNYLAHLAHSETRLWELTNTRYILGSIGLAELLNQQFDPVRHSFRQHTAFDFPNIRQNDLTVQTNANGPWALVEFTGALPRAKLYTDWEVRTNDTTALEILGNPNVDVHKLVIVSDPVPPPPPGNSNAAPGTVEFVSYAPKHLELKANATAPSILLLNDQFDRDWSVTVNGQPAPLLRCNYLMRGVQVPAGASTVVFHFQPSLTGMKITLAGFGVSVLLCALLALSKPRGAEAAAPPAADPKQK